MEDFFLRSRKLFSHSLWNYNQGLWSSSKSFFFFLFFCVPSFTFYNSTKPISQTITQKSNTISFCLSTHILNSSANLSTFIGDSVSIFQNHSNLVIVISFTTPYGLTLQNFEKEDFFKEPMFPLHLLNMIILLYIYITAYRIIFRF